MNAPQFTTRMAANKRAVIEIYDLIGPAWLGMINAEMVSSALTQLGEVDTIEVHINSKGGDAFEGVAIHNKLKQHPARVEMHVDGVAASAASIVLMAGDKITVPKNAIVMIHNPRTIGEGGESELNAAIAQWKSVRTSAIETYTARTGLTAEAIQSMMATETWMTGEEAVAKKFADTVGPELKLPQATTLQAHSVPPFFTKAPQLVTCLMAMTPAPKEPTMTVPAPNPPAPPTVTPPVTTLQTPAPGQPAGISVEQAIADERSRVANITAMCNSAGKTELAQRWIDEGTKVIDVQTALFSSLCAERPPVGGAGGTDLSAQTGDAKFRAEYAASRSVFLQQGLTEADYVASRRVDEGLDPLSIARK